MTKTLAIKRCPHCCSRNTRRSRTRSLERLLCLLFLFPRCCRTCYTRFYRFS